MNEQDTCLRVVFSPVARQGLARPLYYMATGQTALLATSLQEFFKPVASLEFLLQQVCWDARGAALLLEQLEELQAGVVDGPELARLQSLLVSSRLVARLLACRYDKVPVLLKYLPNLVLRIARECLFGTPCTALVGLILFQQC
jgi:hypothetical protein